MTKESNSPHEQKRSKIFQIIKIFAICTVTLTFLYTTFENIMLSELFSDQDILIEAYESELVQPIIIPIPGGYFMALRKIMFTEGQLDNAYIELINPNDSKDKKKIPAYEEDDEQIIFLILDDYPEGFNIMSKDGECLNRKPKEKEKNPMHAWDF